jgi:hypothetical protein
MGSLTNNLLSITQRRRKVEIIPDDNIFFVDCKSTDRIYGENLESIVAFAMKSMKLPERCDNTISEDENKMKTDFINYCKTISEKCGTPDVKRSTIKIENNTAEAIRNAMKTILPGFHDPQFDQLIEKAVENASGKLELKSIGLKELFFQENKKKFSGAKFMIMKVYCSKEILQIAPMYVKVSGNLNETWSWISTNITSDATMEFEEQKFMLTKFDIEEIIKMLKTVPKDKWTM